MKYDRGGMFLFRPNTLICLHALFGPHHSPVWGLKTLNPVGPACLLFTEYLLFWLPKKHTFDRGHSNKTIPFLMSPILMVPHLGAYNTHCSLTEKSICKELHSADALIRDKWVYKVAFTGYHNMKALFNSNIRETLNQHITDVVLPEMHEFVKNNVSSLLRDILALSFIPNSPMSLISLTAQWFNEEFTLWRVILPTKHFRGLHTSQKPSQMCLMVYIRHGPSLEVLFTLWVVCHTPFSWLLMKADAGQWKPVQQQSHWIRV